MMKINMSIAYRLEHEIQHLKLISRKRRELTKITDPRRQAILKEVKLSPSQKEQIDEVYIKNYGKRISYDWHRLYMSFTGQFDARYFPELLYIPRFESFMNTPDYSSVFADKNLLTLLTGGLQGVSVPHTFISCCNGIFRDENMALVSEQRASDILSSLGEVFVKPTVDSCSGSNCRVVNFIGGGQSRN